MNVRTTSTLREGLAVIGRGIKGEPRWFAVAVVGSVIYGVMTGLTAWAIGWVVDTAVSPAITAGLVTGQQLWFIGGVVTLVVLVTTVGVIGRRLAGGVAMFNLGATYRRKVTRSSCLPPGTTTSRQRRPPQTRSGRSNSIESVARSANAFWAT